MIGTTTKHKQQQRQQQQRRRSGESLKVTNGRFPMSTLYSDKAR